jgi:hypothetical protein
VIGNVVLVIVLSGLFVFVQSDGSVLGTSALSSSEDELSPSFPKLVGLSCGYCFE